MNRISRGHAIKGLAFAVAGTALAPIVAKAAGKSVVCQPCKGNGNCQSGSCVNGLCAPYDNVCGGNKRPLYTCKVSRKGVIRPKCCGAGGQNCKAI